MLCNQYTLFPAYVRTNSQDTPFLPPLPLPLPLPPFHSWGLASGVEGGELLSFAVIAR